MFAFSPSLLLPLLVIFSNIFNPSKIHPNLNEKIISYILSATLWMMMMTMMPWQAVGSTLSLTLSHAAAAATFN